MKRRRVYLGGGFRSGWQRRVIEGAPQIGYIDPSKHNLVEASEYTPWDLFAIRSCDVFFGYLELSNPAGYALSLELGYAKALNKLVVLVDEKSGSDPDKARYFAMLRNTADITFDTLDEGIRFLRTLQE